MTEDIEAKELSRAEKAFFSGLKCILASTVIGTLIVVFVEDSMVLRQLIIFMVFVYIIGVFYRWNRLKTLRIAKKGVIVDGPA